MSYEPSPISLREFLHQAEQAHRFFQNELRDGRGKPHAVMAQLELLQFYGRAFAQIVRLLSEEAPHDAWQTVALEEAVRGRTIFWEWQRSLTSLLSPLELYQMQAHWDSLTELIQACA